MSEKRDALRQRFLNELGQQVVRKLHSVGYPLNPRRPVEEVLQAYLNAQRRLVARKPRAVVWSDELRSKRLPENIRQGLEAVERDATVGNDLTPYLHDAWDNADYDDRLLNDWGIHHFHLGAPERKRAVGRTHELLFAIVLSDAMLLLDVRTHHSFADSALIEIAHRNFPSAIAHARVHGASKLDAVSDADRMRFRNAGIVAFVSTADGTVYAPPGGGYMQSGLSFSIAVTVDRLMEKAVSLADFIDRAKLSGSVFGIAEAPEFELEVIFDGLRIDGLCVRERRSGKQLWA